MNASAVQSFRDPRLVAALPADAAWHWLVHSLGDVWLFVAFYLFMTVCYVGAGGLLWVAEQRRVLPQWRLQPGKWPQNAEYVKTLWNIAQNYLLVILPMCFVAPTVLEAVGISAYGPLPSWPRVVFDLVFCAVVEDVFQYILHRALHLPSFYWIHKIHHEWTTPFGLAASYAHPIEIFVLSLAAFAGPVLCRPHLASFFAWMWFRQMDAVKTHSGWVWPGVDHVLHMLPSYGGAVFHDYHHKTFLFNYASRLQFIDVVFGTYKAPYDPMHPKSSPKAE